ncbi:hypothetical protein MSG28_011052 [Choristoneura fumiferana]|uniref:Uncharacterized protein n=1 Tax=Choristoneura fumiferana TaxID=7141 RepID=A0ACC0KQA3_CHOFU|nr:hypothetical protein MSG28_011052 [Choristoneura fumiferana]
MVGGAGSSGRGESSGAYNMADVTSPPILGRHACKEMNLIKRVFAINESNAAENPFVAEYQDVFQGLGCLPGTYKIRLNYGCKPVVHAPRKVPIPLREKVKDKLEDMERQGIISKVEGPTDWVNSMTIVKKPNGDLRICLDPKELNAAIRREHFRLPTLDEIVSKLSGAQYFSTLDATNGFWQCKFGMEEIKYLGHRITRNGLYPDESHISAIVNMPRPTNCKDIERLLGLTTYVGNFIPNLSEKTKPLRELLKKEVEWHWTDLHENAWTLIKKCLSQTPVLQYYSMSKPITLSVDASKSGLGAVLLQNGLPVCYASKALTNTEQRYAQIEKELYACVFACEKFYGYVYGRTDITIETDHKPLISIIKKPIVDAPPRLQRMLLRLQPYTFNLVYKPGKQLHIADALSRAYEPPTAADGQPATAPAPYDLHDEMTEAVRTIMAHNELTDVHYQNLQKETEQDSELQQLRKYIRRGWPEDKKHVNDIIKPYWQYKEDLTEANGHGIPETVMSDGGPQFTSREFSQFAKKWGFNHVRSSPHYAQSNGQAERSIQTYDSFTSSLEYSDDPKVNTFARLKKDTLVNEYVTPQERNEENAFMDTIMSTAVIRYVTPDPRQQRDFLKQLWFGLYSRGKGKISSSGFEHIFVSELKNGDVLGLHNWIFFAREEAANRVNYLGYLKYVQLNDKGVVMKLHFNQNGVDKPVNSMFIGTSPELEIALYTLCFITRADNDCDLKLGNKDGYQQSRRSRASDRLHNIKHRHKKQRSLGRGQESRLIWAETEPEISPDFWPRFVETETETKISVGS